MQDNGYKYSTKISFHIKVFDLFTPYIYFMIMGMGTGQDWEKAGGGRVRLWGAAVYTDPPRHASYPNICIITYGLHIWNDKEQRERTEQVD